MSTTLKRAERRLDRACADVAAELEAMLRAEVLRVAKTHSDVTVQAYSAMGTWAFYVGNDRDSRNPPCFRAFQRVLDTYGWAAIPAPVAFICRDGSTVERLTDW